MAFSTRRGRPKSARPSTDMGTPELQRKRRAGLTQEAIDLCLEKGLITPSLHWCGLHLRWLYTLRYGAPGISSALHRFYDAPAAKPDDPAWRSAREAEFAEAATMLRHHKRYAPVAQLAIFNERPRFLNDAWRKAAWENRRTRDTILTEYQWMHEGLCLLERCWKPDPRITVPTSPQ
jgi:hypothetical protein